jgi:predicted TIM-barrel fold metal-dependent hydrolase
LVELENKLNERPNIIDADVHNTVGDIRKLLPFLPRAFHHQWLAGPGLTGGYYGNTGGVMRRDARTDNGGPAGSDPIFLKQHHLDAYGIDYAILTGHNFDVSLNPDPDFGNAVASALNDWMVETWLMASPQFKGSILINHSDVPAAAKEIERMASHPDMVQVVMCSAARQLYGQRYYHPIYEVAERNGLPIAIHPGSEGKGISGAPTPSGHPTRYFEWHNILPINFMAHVNSLVCEGVFEKFHGLKFVALEGGISWMPHLMWRMDKNYKALRNTVPWLKRMPSEYIRDHIYLTTQPIEEPEQPNHLNDILDMINGDHMIMYSSDYPHWDFDNPQVAMRQIRRDRREKILADNATNLYGLHTKPQSTQEEVAQ